MKNWIISLILIISPLFQVLGEESIPKNPIKFGVQLFKDSEKRLYLALNYENYPHWHTYWKNPGDAGLPLKYEFKADNVPFKLEEMPWPIPHRFIEQGDILTFGHTGRYSLFFLLPEKRLSELKNRPLTIKASWLACKQICIPGEVTVKGSIQNGRFIPKIRPKVFFSEDELRENLKSLPKAIPFPDNLDLFMAKNKANAITLFYSYETPNLLPSLTNKNFLIPYPQSPFDFKREALFKDKKDNLYGRMDIDWDGEYSEPVIPFPKDGKFDRPYNLKFLMFNPKLKTYSIINKAFSSLNLHRFDQSNSFFSILTPLEDQGPPPSEVQKKNSPKIFSFWYYLLFAILGGILLNIMPCVLPVISLKIFYLIKHRQASKSQVLRHNLFYSLGIFFTFAVLATLILVLKSGGELIGWGFQLQSPKFLAFIIFILFVLSLNLFGLFHFVTPGGNFLGNIKVKEGHWGDFLSGVLTTILATPCSAPFLGTALTFAFTSTTYNIFVIFFGIAFGLALPFLLVGVFPSLISFLPKPGLWMDKLKKVLGLALLLTVIWLFDVITDLNLHPRTLQYLGTSLAMIFFAFYARKHLTKNKFIAFFTFLLPLALIGNIIISPTVYMEKGVEVIDQNLPWQSWSVGKMEEYKLSKRFIFVDFTAKWCLTCKVNEKLVLHTESFKQLVKKHDIVLLLADWTKRDPNITNWLFSNGKVGVPAYFIVDKSGNLIDLGETISIDEIKSHLK